jgi:membrane glycosyltransferase
VNAPALARRHAELLASAPGLPADGLQYLARNRDARLTHIEGNLPRAADLPGSPDPNTFTAQQKLRDAGSLDEALQWLTRVERVEIAASPELLNQLAQLPEGARQAVLI